MKKLIALLAALSPLSTIFPSVSRTVRLVAETRADLQPKRTLKFINGQWFDGRDFQHRIFYSVDGTLTSKEPRRVDEVIDLKNGYVVPPFGDAHNHYIAGPHDIRNILDQYLRDGIFYAKNPASIRRDTEQIKNLINKPDSVDVTFANAGLTASGGHPVKLYDKILIKVKAPGPHGNFENLAYYVIDNKEDLERKWPLIVADHPDFIKTHLLYSEEFEKRRDDTAYYGNKGLDPKLLPLIVARAHAGGLRVTCHIETAADFRNALAADVDEIAHLPGYYVDPTHPEWFPITKEDAALAARKGVDVVTTTYVATDEIKKPEDLKKAQAIQINNLRLLHDAGVKLAVGPDVYGVTSLAEIMNLYQLKVFDNLTLLKMWSENSPALIFPGRKIGHLQDSYEASFLVLDGNPLEDFMNIEKIRLRFKQGNFIVPQTESRGPKS
jgi:imidazolonepropionase-like amidohydrolase